MLWIQHSYPFFGMGSEAHVYQYDDNIAIKLFDSKDSKYLNRKKVKN